MEVKQIANDTHTCWKRLMVSRILNCCQRLEKFIFPLMRSGFPRCTNVKSWRMRPLHFEKKIGKLYTKYDLLITINMCIFSLKSTILVFMEYCSIYYK